jgi:histone deacetylase HOS3
MNVQATSRGTTPKPEPSYKQPTKQSTRRLSLASSTGSVATTAAPQLPSASIRVPSTGGTGNPARPGSSQSVRPGSSLSSKPQTTPAVVVKKTRTVNPARSDATKNPRASRKSPPAGLGTDGSQDLPSLPRAPSSSQIPNGSTASKAANKAVTGGIDSITTGMKKITINLSKAKEQAKLAAKSATASASKKPAVQIEENATIHAQYVQNFVTDSGPSLEDPKMPSNSFVLPGLHNISPAAGVSLPQPLSPSRFAHLQDASNVPLPASSPIIPNRSSNFPTPNSAAVSLNNGNSDVFVAYQPEGPPPAPIPQQEPLKWLPPNTSTPVAIKRGDLPVFTSTSAIPFGVNANKGASSSSAAEAVIASSKQQNPEPSIWDVPETPGR